MQSSSATIQSSRLDLIPMSPAFFEASLTGDLATAGQLLGAVVPPDWLAETGLMRIRLDQLRAEPSLQPWLVRAMVLRKEQQMIGHIGFHSRPGADYLSELAPGGVEFGYTVFPSFRRQGYAREAAEALMAWAHREHRVTRFVVTISPDNLPSLGLAQQFGFKQIGSHIDEEDGPEDIFLLQLADA